MNGRRWRSLVYGCTFIATAIYWPCAGVGVFFALMDFVENSNIE